MSEKRKVSSEAEIYNLNQQFDLLMMQYVAASKEMERAKKVYRDIDVTDPGVTPDFIDDLSECCTLAIQRYEYIKTLICGFVFAYRGLIFLGPGEIDIYSSGDQEARRPQHAIT